jgi:hypothetical protein
VVYGCGVLIE